MLTRDLMGDHSFFFNFGITRGAVLFPGDDPDRAAAQRSYHSAINRERATNRQSGCWQQPMSFFQHPCSGAAHADVCARVQVCP